MNYNDPAIEADHRGDETGVRDGREEKEQFFLTALQIKKDITSIRGKCTLSSSMYVNIVMSQLHQQREPKQRGAHSTTTI